VDLTMQSLVMRFQEDHELTSLKEDEAFEAFAGFCVLSSFYGSGFYPDAFRTGGGNDLGIDAFGILINGELLHDSAEVRAATEQTKKLDVQVIVIQAKTSPGFEEKVIANLADDLTQVVSPKRMTYAASADIRNLRECLDAVYRDLAKLSGGLPRLHIRYVTTGAKVSGGVGEKARQAQERLSGLDRFSTVDFRCVTHRELQDLYRQATEAVGANFEMIKKISLPKIPGVRQALLGLLPARDLVEHVLTDPGGGIRESLFYENVRGFQGYNDVNDQIRGTLCDEQRKERFAVLNNGITIVTRELTVAGDDIQIRDFQIVNGCQTCHVLVDERSRLDDAVQVSIRLVHTQDKDVIDGIVAGTNLQTYVSEQELSAREDFHRDLEEFFFHQPEGRRLYYERRSRQYSSLQEVPKTRIISMSQLARAYLATFLEEPDRVGHFKEVMEKRKDLLFRDDHQLAAYYAAASVYYQLESMIRKGRIPADLRPARFHILSAMKIRIIGPGPLPRAAKAARAKCDKLLEAVWDPASSERLVFNLLPVLRRSIDAERVTGTPLSEMVRTKRFAERVQHEVLR
jgi:hypothetical protein